MGDAFREPARGDSPPLLFFYTHLHDAIRAELYGLSEAVLRLESNGVATHEMEPQLARLRARYRFLEQIYKYHSSVEDEVVYPALDSKVKNVTLAYMVEHEDEEHLLEELSALLANALEACMTVTEAASLAPNVALADAVRQLARKVEEVHTTLRKHLAKEETQLLPLLLQHFSFSEQAELVAQFLCCIPLAALGSVLTWLKRGIPLDEQISLRNQVQTAVQDPLLRQLMVTWLAPLEGDRGKNPPAVTTQGSKEVDEPAINTYDSKEGNDTAVDPGTPNADVEFVCCGCSRGEHERTSSSSGLTAPPRCLRDVEDAVLGPISPGKPPLREILYFHQAIRSALSSFVTEARGLRASAENVSAAAQLAALVERHRFIRAVCLFHSASEDEILFPALRRVVSRPQGRMDSTSLDRHRCEEEHAHESVKFEELGRLLGDVKAYARRGAKEVAELTGTLSSIADELARAMSHHMAREETDVLPVLMRSLCVAEQRHMVWRLLRAMPLRLLERVMPWVAGKLRQDDVHEWLGNIRRAAPLSDEPLVELLFKWASRAATGGDPTASEPSSRKSRHEESRVPLRRLFVPGSDDPAAYSNETCAPTAAHAIPQLQAEEGHASFDAADLASLPYPKRIRTDRSSTIPAKDHDILEIDGKTLLQNDREMSVPLDRGEQVFDAMPSAMPSAQIVTSGSPIDHIFQFHKALRRELHELEHAAVELQAAVDAASGWPTESPLSGSISALQVRFQFLRGIYRAHSSAEDEIVFPALEAKETLHNVSRAYTLDHEQEETLFEDVAAIVDELGACSSAKNLQKLRILASRLSRMCAAVRASLETHVRAEEKELWPLFAEHFTIEEQEHLVGVIIGRTGAEVLRSMLSWVEASMTQDEREAMMISIKSASKGTAFSQWLDAAMRISSAAEEPLAASPRPMVLSWEDEQKEILAEVATYLATQQRKGGISSAGICMCGPGSGGGKNDGVLGDANPRQGTEADPASIVADSALYRPGWEDIFRMNQKQLEAAVRRVSADDSLEPQRKAYLIQHLMASRYIVAQQRRMAGASSASSAVSTPTVGNAISPVLLGGDGNQGGAVTASCVDASMISQGGHSSCRHYHDAERKVLGCKHYRRNALLVAPCCGEEHVCRLCHDEAVPGHQLDRYAVTEMRCMLCGARQSVAQSCNSCGASLARYYCGICHLFDDDSGRDIYHCPFCNFCRRGKGLGVDSFHCMFCNACMSLELFNKHRCTEAALAGDCPVCSDTLFQSAAPIKELPCGHFMHSMCFAAYTRYSYTCPVCSKSLGDMAVYWKMIDALLAAETLPSEYQQRRQTVRCNDCGIETNAPFHFVYHKCTGCGGYNTRLL